MVVVVSEFLFIHVLVLAGIRGGGVGELASLPPSPSQLGGSSSRRVGTKEAESVVTC